MATSYVPHHNFPWFSPRSCVEIFFHRRNINIFQRLSWVILVILRTFQQTIGYYFNSPMLTPAQRSAITKTIVGLMSLRLPGLSVNGTRTHIKTHTHTKACTRIPLDYILQGIWNTFSSLLILNLNLTEICFITHWGRDKIAAISQTTLSNSFSWMKMLEFRLKFLEICSIGSNLQYSTIGSDNGLAPSRRQAIIWTNDG